MIYRTHFATSGIEANVYAYQTAAGNTPYLLRRKSEVLVIMLNQKLNPTPSEDLTIDVDLLYETDPCELKAG